MKISNKIKPGIILLSLLTISIIAGAVTIFTQDYEKVIEEEFNWSSRQKVAIHNLYGQVDVRSWDQNKVKITSTIKVDAQSEDKAQEVFDRISINFNESSNEIAAVTNIESNSSWSWSWWGGSSEKYSINYTVLMPSKAHVHVSNKYGNCHVNGITNSASFDIKYGDVKVHNGIQKVDADCAYGEIHLDDVTEAEIELRYGDLEIKSVEDLDIESAYSDVEIGDAGDMKVESMYDDYELGRIGTLNYEGKYDDYEIDEVAGLEIDGMYCDFNVGHLHHFAEVDIRYGELVIKELSGKFRKVNLDGMYADFRLGTENLDAFDVQFEGRYADLTCPKDFVNTSEDKSGTHLERTGYMHRNGSGRNIVADLSYGNLILR